jgi:hypothetical protein
MNNNWRISRFLTRSVTRSENPPESLRDGYGFQYGGERHLDGRLIFAQTLVDDQAQ